MKLRIFALIAASVAPATVPAEAQLSITGNSQYSENFDSFEGTQLSIPPNFLFSDTDFDPGGFYNRADAYSNLNSTYALRDNSSSTDIAFGRKGPTSSSDLLGWHLINNSGSSITSFVVTWDFEQYSEGGRATSLLFTYNPAESGFTTSGISGDIVSVASAGGSNANLPAIFLESMTITVTPQSPILDGELLTLGWTFQSGAGSGSNAHIGVDNVTFQVVPEPETTAMLFGAMGILALLRRRSR
jgi:hypothetical protein